MRSLYSSRESPVCFGQTSGDTVAGVACSNEQLYILLEHVLVIAKRRWQLFKQSNQKKKRRSSCLLARVPGVLPLSFEQRAGNQWAITSTTLNHEPVPICRFSTPFFFLVRAAEAGTWILRITQLSLVGAVSPLSLNEPRWQSGPRVSGDHSLSEPAAVPMVHGASTHLLHCASTTTTQCH
jgi:hypothetical protein